MFEKVNFIKQDKSVHLDDIFQNYPWKIPGVDSRYVIFPMGIPVYLYDYV